VTFLNEVKKRQKDLIKLVLNEADFSSLPRSLVFSTLGARICYASSHPLSIAREERFKDKEKSLSFLLRLKRAGHFSVFAHTPVVVNTKSFDYETKYHLARTYFKAFFDENEKVAYFNLRHFAESLDDETFSKLTSVDLDLKGIKTRVFSKTKDEWQEVFAGSLAEAVKINWDNKKQDKKREPEVIVLQDEFFPNWYVVVAHDFSRVFSHQFVRHTWLNFNQRSHRYTKVDAYVVPQGLEKEHLKLYEELFDSVLLHYETLIKKGVKKESARFIVPQGAATTVMASGTKFVWEDFIEKRAIPQAQEEVRSLALLLKRILQT